MQRPVKMGCHPMPLHFVLAYLEVQLCSSNSIGMFSFSTYTGYIFIFYRLMLYILIGAFKTLLQLIHENQESHQSSMITEKSSLSFIVSFQINLLAIQIILINIFFSTKLNSRRKLSNSLKKANQNNNRSGIQIMKSELHLASLQYPNKPTLHELSLLYEERIREQQIKHSPYYSEAVLAYPFFFAEEQREAFVIKRQNQLFEQLKNSIIKTDEEKLAQKQFVIIKKYKKQQATEPTRIYFINKFSLNIEKDFGHEPSSEELKLLLNKIENQEVKNLCIGIYGKQRFQGRPKVALGRSTVEKNCITCEDSSVSRKHLLLYRNQKSDWNDQSIIAFICAVRNAWSDTQLFKIPNSIIKQIISYIGEFKTYKYSLMDNYSSNGSFYVPKQPIFLNHSKVQYIYGVDNLVRIKSLSAVKFVGVVKESIVFKEWFQKLNQAMIIGGNGVMGTEAHAIAIRIKNRNGSTSTNVLVFSGGKREFRVGRGDFDVKVNSQEIEIGECVAKIYFDSKYELWKLQHQNHPLWVKMVQKSLYQIRNKTHIRLGYSSYLTIETPQ